MTNSAPGAREVPVFDELIRRWWIVAARGVVALLFGAAAFLAPERTQGLLMSLFGLFAIGEGVFTMGAGLSLSWLSLFLEGVAGGAIGLFTFFYPPTAAIWFVYLIAAWALMTGVLELGGAIRLRKVVNGPMVKGEYLLAITGALTVVLGVVAVVSPDQVTLAFTWIVGGYAVLSGALLLALAMNIRSWQPTARA
jgi:uncharacterized membrane protein HdeD (DUF308 family)